MADPKAAKAAPTQAEAQAKATQEHEAAASSPQQRFVAVGRLRRDTMILASSEDANEMNELASAAVREGRAAEVFIFEAVGYFSESEVDFIPAPIESRAQRADSGEARPPLLNPSTGEQAEGAGNTAVQATIPTGGASGSGDSNAGAGVGTGNDAKLKGDKKD